MVVLHTRGRPRGAPWPDHGRLGGVGIPLAYADRNSTRLITIVPPDQGTVTPTEYGEQARNPIFGGTFAIRDLSRGYGRKRCRKDPDGRYYYGLNVDPSAGPWLKGPSLTTFTPGTKDSTVGITRWFEIGGRLFALNGRYAQNFGTDGTYVGVSKDFGANKAATDVVVLQTNQSGSTRYALVGMGDSENVWYFDGATGTTTWTQTTGANAFKARQWAVDAENVYWVNDSNKLNQCSLDADVLTVTNHSAPIDRIGTYDHGVNRMYVDATGALGICKADDLYTLDPEGRVNRLFERLQFPPATTNGEALSHWRNDTYVTYGGATYRLTPDGGLTPIGPELVGDNDSVVGRGYATAHCGTDHRLYLGLYNADTGNSYLMVYQGDVTTDDHGNAIPVWHGSITAAFSGVKILSLHQTTIGAPTGHKRLYIGLSDGTGAYFTLPCTFNPAACSNYAFSTADGSLYLGRLNFYFAGERKTFFAARGEGDNFTSLNYGQFSFRTADSASYTTLAPNFNTSEAKRALFPDQTSGVFMDGLVTLVSSATTSGPIMTGLAIEWQLRSLPRYVCQALIPAEDGLRRRDGTPYRRGAREIRNWLDYLAGAAWAVPFIDPDGVTRQVTVLTPERRTAWDAETRQPRDSVRVTLVDPLGVAATIPASGQYAWYKADAGTGQTVDGSAITTWSDQSGNARNLTQGTAARRPLYKTSRQNGLPAVVFDGSNDSLGSGAYASTVGQPYEFWLALRVHSLTDGLPIFDGRTSGTLLGPYVLCYEAGGTTGLQLIVTSASGSNVLSAYKFAAWAIVRVYCDGTSSHIAMNNNAYIVGGANVGTDPLAAFVLADDSTADGAATTPMDVGEVLIYSRALTELEAQQNWSYLNDRWGVF